MSGSVLNNRYRLDEPIGRGTFGEVYRGFDLQLKRTVAVKVLISPGENDRFKARFMQESEALAGLHDANIVTVFDFGDDGGKSFLVMEYIDGPTLLDACKDLQGDLPRTVRIATGVCDAMQHAHAQGIIHRDLTLRNVMIDGKGHARLLDFGLARVLQTELKSKTGSVVGTVSYMAPEQTTGRSVDGRADIFAFGVCLYRLLSGSFPFEADHPAAVVYLIHNEEPARLPAHVPIPLQDIVLKCLEKKPEHRFQSFADVKAALTALSQTSISSSAATISAVVTAIPRGPHNPYLNRVMIKDPDAFFGRVKEVKRIYSRLDAPRPQSVSIVGERRMGKSSLLNYVYHRRNRRLHMENHRDSVFLYMDFQRIQDVDVEKFIDIVFNMVTYELGEEISAVSSGRNLEMLNATIEKLDSRGMRIVVLMDEFDAITNNPNFDMQFFSFLRYLANNFRVAYVTSSHSDLQQMCHDKDIADSPFFNIFSTLQLRPFSRDEAQSLIAGPSGQEGVPLGGYADRILGLSGFFPLFIQIACSSVYEAIVDRPGAEPDWNEVDRAFTDEASLHYAFVWERMEEAARENLRRIALGREVDRRFVHVNEDLVRRGYLLDGGSEPRVFSEPFRRFVLGQSERADGALRSSWRKWLGRK